MFSRRSMCLLMLVVLLAGLGAAAPRQESLVRRLVQEDLFTWYQSQTDAELDPSYAGAYVMLAVGDELFLGLSASVPTHDHNGALFAAHDGASLRLIAPLDEQDVNRMRAVDDTIFIPGYDPNDGWDAGNLYRYDTQTDAFTKLRYRYSEPHFVDATTTDANGKYSFSGLKPTSYIVKFILPAGYGFSAQQVGYDFLQDSNPSPASGADRICASGRNMPFQAMEAYADLTIDAGVLSVFPETDPGEPLAPPAANLPDRSFYSGGMTIGDWVWVDSNGDGLQDKGEAGLAGVRVELYALDPYFPCVIHASGFWADAETGKLYYNGGAIGSNITFVSEDAGRAWHVLSQDGDYYWARDFVEFNGHFYKIHREITTYGAAQHNYAVETVILFSRDAIQWSALQVPEAAEVHYKASDGTTWAVKGMTLDETNALLEFQGKLIVLEAHGKNLYAVAEGGTFETYPINGADLSVILPEFHEPDFPAHLPNDVTGASNRHNTLANANDELLYAIGGDNVLYATPNLTQWYPVVDFNTVEQGAPLISLTFWDARQWLVAATAGETGSIYYLPHDKVLAAISNS